MAQRKITINGDVGSPLLLTVGVWFIAIMLFGINDSLTKLIDKQQPIEVRVAPTTQPIGKSNVAN
jgi:hypothetical protein